MKKEVVRNGIKCSIVWPIIELLGKENKWKNGPFEKENILHHKISPPQPATKEGIRPFLAVINEVIR
jgi:hypothetical protein